MFKFSRTDLTMSTDVTLRSEYKRYVLERGNHQQHASLLSLSRCVTIALLLEGDEPRRVGGPLTGHVRKRAGAAGPRRERVRAASDDGQPAGVARLDCRSQCLLQVDLLRVHVGRHVARQTLQ